MHRRYALIALTIVCPALGWAALDWAALDWAALDGGELAPWVFILACALTPSLLVIAGAASGSGEVSRALWIGMLGVASWLALCLTVMWWRRGLDPEAFLFPPWPDGLWVQLGGLLGVTLPVVVWLYAHTFDRDGITAQDLETLRRRFPSGPQAPTVETDP